MARVVNIHEAKTHFSRLVDRAVAGEDIVIAKAGRPVAKLVGYSTPKEPRKLGLLKGKIWIAPDFDAFDQEIAKLFEGD
jgi:prevent-host-death family protein